MGHFTQKALSSGRLIPRTRAAASPPQQARVAVATRPNDGGIPVRDAAVGASGGQCEASAANEAAPTMPAAFRSVAGTMGVRSVSNGRNFS